MSLTIDREFIRRVAAHKASYLPASITSANDYLRAVETELNDLADLASPEVCALRHRKLGLAGDPRGLAERWVRLSSGQITLAGARFKNLDPNFPFVEVQSADALSVSDREELRAVLPKEFRTIAPLGFKFRDRAGVHRDLEAWSHTLFGAITRSAGPSLPATLRADFTRDLSWLPEYEAGYRERLRQNPALQGYVRIGEAEEFFAAAADDALLILRDERGLAGVVAGIKGPLYGLPALYIIESYLADRWVGRGLAPLAHRIFWNGVAGAEYVWGTIYDQNLPSLRTAERLGRARIETEYFVKF